MNAGVICQDWLGNCLCNASTEEIQGWFGEIFNEQVSIDFVDGTLWLVSRGSWATQEQIDRAVKTIEAMA